VAQKQRGKTHAENYSAIIATTNKEYNNNKEIKNKYKNFSK
jgi:hypothetical protein